MRDLATLCNGGIRALAKDGMFAAKVTGIVDATDLETTAPYEGWGQITRMPQIRDTRGKEHEIVVFDWPAQFRARQAQPLLTAPVVEATVAPETTTPPSGTRHGPSTQRPWPVYRAGSVSLRPSHGSVGTAATAGVS